MDLLPFTLGLLPAYKVALVLLELSLCLRVMLSVVHHNIAHIILAHVGLYLKNGKLKSYYYNYYCTAPLFEKYGR